MTKVESSSISVVCCQTLHNLDNCSIHLILFHLMLQNAVSELAAMQMPGNVPHIAIYHPQGIAVSLNLQHQCTSFLSLTVSKVRGTDASVNPPWCPTSVSHY